MKKLETLIKNLSFVKEFPDDVEPQSYWWIKHYRKHKFFKGLHIIVTDRLIEVWCKEEAFVTGDNDEVCVIKKKLTRENLIEIDNLLSNSQ